MELLYICAQWHALAKLRLHNDFTVDFLDYTTKLLGSHMRGFAQETSSLQTKELAKEAQARARKEGNANAKGTTTRKLAKFSVFTIKFHFLGDYVSTIRWFGTSDSYSTETVRCLRPPSIIAACLRTKQGELAHRLPKSWYPRTDKKDFEVQMSQIERRQARLGQIRSNNAATSTPPTNTPPPSTRESTGEDSLGRRYIMAKNQDTPIDILLLRRVQGSDHGDIYTEVRRCH